MTDRHAVDLSTCDDPNRCDELKRMLRRLLSLDRQPLDKSKGGETP